MSVPNVKTRTGIYLTIATGLITIMSCKNEVKPKTTDAVTVHMASHDYPLLDNAMWIVGSWKGVLGQGVSVENWTKLNDSTLSGAGLFIKGNVNIAEESILLYQKGNELFYMPTVKNQNDGKPVIFKMSIMTPKKMIFENMQHDFPQKITYIQMAADSMVATISGIDKGMMRSESFPMTRKQ